jgi:hypothetical protein
MKSSLSPDIPFLIEDEINSNLSSVRALAA